MSGWNRSDDGRRHGGGGSRGPAPGGYGGGYGGGSCGGCGGSSRGSLKRGSGGYQHDNRSRQRSRSPRRGVGGGNRDGDGRDSGSCAGGDHGPPRPTGPPLRPPQQSHRSEEYQQEPIHKVFNHFIRRNQCPLSACGLGEGFLEQQPWAKEAVEKVCGGVPSRVPRGCNGSQKNEHGLLDHAKNKSHASVDEDDDDSDEYFAKELHKKFSDYLDRTIPLQDQLKQLQGQFRGQAASSSSRARKMAMDHQQEKSSLVQKYQAALDEQAERHQQDMEKAREEGAKRLEDIQREFGEVAMDEAARSSKQARKLEQQLEKMQADKRQLLRELQLTKDGLKRQKEERKAEIERIAQELQSTNQELERENLERLQAEDKQKNEAARQRIQQMEERLKKAEQEKANLHEQMEEEAQHYGVLTGQEHMYKEASATVFGAIKHRFANDSRVPWREFGELDGKTLRDRGLKGDDFRVMTITDLWQNGFWNENPKEDHDVSTYGPPFIAKWAFKRVSNEPVAYEIREKDEKIHYERQMPLGMLARRETITYSAAFVQHMRGEYRGKADALLRYLLDKYVEYQSHSSGLGYSGYSVIRKIWNEREDREMTLPEMCELLVSLTG